jgi:segregation and condensation protein B
MDFHQNDENEVVPTNEHNELMQKLEALLMVTSEPLNPAKVCQVLEISISESENALEHLFDYYSKSSFGYFLQKVAGGYRFTTKPEMSSVLEAFALSQSSARLSMAALETLAIVAYRQPISRTQIGSIRGVNSDSVLRMLVSRGYLEISARDSGPGNAMLYSTTSTFLEKLGLFSLDELPPIEGYMPGNEIAEALEASLFND